MTEIGALVCEAILNFDEDGEEQADVTSPASLRDLVGWVVVVERSGWKR